MQLYIQRLKSYLSHGSKWDKLGRFQTSNQRYKRLIYKLISPERSNHTIVMVKAKVAMYWKSTTNGFERFPICHGTSYFRFVLTFSFFCMQTIGNFISARSARIEIIISRANRNKIYYNITKAKRALWVANSASTICPWVYAADVITN